MLAQKIVLITVIALTELVTARSDSLVWLVQIKLVHLTVVNKDIVLEDHVCATHNLLDVIVHLLNAPMLALVLEHVST